MASISRMMFTPRLSVTCRFLRDIRLAFSRQSSGTGLRSMPALLRGADIVQVQGRSNQCEMRKRLREITDLPPCMRIVFFREQADVVAK